MKKYLSAMLSAIMLLTTVSPCFTVIAAEIEQNNVVTVCEKVTAMSEEYNKEYEEKLDSAQAAGLSVDNRLIVETKSKINTYDAVDEVYGLGYAFIQFDNEEDAEKAAAQYEKQGLTVQNDNLYTVSASSSSTESDWAYKYSEADTTLKYFKNTDNPQIIVGIIDTGIYYDHTKMKDRIIRTNKNFSTSYIRDRENDEHGHGTNVAGVIAQSTPDNVKLSGFKVADGEGHIYSSGLICAYEYILAMKENQPDILNMSYGGYEPESTVEKHLFQELKDSGIALIAAAGNENVDTKDSTPANNENVLAVSAYDENGNKCWFSNYGTTVDIAAPGENVKTYKVANSDSYEYVNGTSFSSPFVAAAAAYVLMQDSSRTPDDIYEILKNSAIKRNKTSDKMWAGSGLLNFSNLIESDERKSDVTFSIDSGTYSDTIKVELSCADRLNTKIVYTTDNTLPSSTNGTTYRKAIEIDSQATIIAAAFPIVGSSMHSKYTMQNYQIFRNADENDFEITDEGVITAYNGKYASIKVPDTIKGITPVEIGVGCFMDSGIVNIELPDTVKDIEYDAFNGSALERIVGLGVESCSTRSFKECYSLYDENMPNIKSLYPEAFYGCNLLTDLTFREKLEYATTQCLSGTGLQNADFPNITWENCSFENTPITYANLPKITNLSGGFKDCKMLKEVDIPNVTRIGCYAFANCISLPKEMDFTNITELESHAFEDSQFEKLDLPNCIKTWGYAFVNSKAKTINIPNCKDLGGDDFSGSSLECVNMESVEKIGSGSSEFLNCFSLKYVYAPNSKQIPSFISDNDGRYQLSQGVVPALEFIYAPKATEFNYNYCEFKEFTNLKFIYAPKLERIANFANFPKSDDFTLYLSDSLKEGKNQEAGILGKYTVVAPEGSYAHQWAKKKWFYYPGGLNFIPSDSRNENIENPANVTDLGRSICCSAAGLRFGFTWENIKEIESLASDVEYGFIYSQKGAENLSIETVGSNGIKRVKADNRIDHGKTTSFNLVISNIPNSYYDREITARAYVCIDGMYFYSNIQKGSFGEVANLVLADDEIDTNTKNAVKNLLEV